MHKGLLVFCFFLANLVYAEEMFSYRIAPDCIQDLDITENVDIAPPLKPGYQINILLKERESTLLQEFTGEIIGSKLNIVNGLGDSLNVTPRKVVHEFGASFRLSPYESLTAAETAVRLIRMEGGSCGRGSNIHVETANFITKSRVLGSQTRWRVFVGRMRGASA